MLGQLFQDYLCATPVELINTIGGIIGGGTIYFNTIMYYERFISFVVIHLKTVFRI